MDAIPKYHIGQAVHFSALEVKRGAPGGAFRVERLLPPENGEPQYRVKAVDNGRERVARECQIGGRVVIEALAQSLYEADNVTKVPWARRDRTVREPWLREALAHLAKSENAKSENN